MNFELPPIGGIGHTPPAAGAEGAGKTASRFSVSAGKAIPATPPPTVLEQMYDAARVAEKLRAQERELHFEQTPGGRVVIQVRDLNGNVIRTVPPSEALEIAGGAPLR